VIPLVNIPDANFNFGWQFDSTAERDRLHHHLSGGLFFLFVTLKNHEVLYIVNRDQDILYYTSTLVGTLQTKSDPACDLNNTMGFN